MTTKQLTVLEKAVIPVVAEASALVIIGTDTLTLASTLRENIKRVQKDIEADKEELYRPAKMVLDEINARYKPFEAPLKEALKIVNEKMSAYQTKAIQDATKEAEAIANRVKEGKGNLSPATAMKRIDELEKPAVLDMTGFVNKPLVWVTNDGLIPRHFLTPDFKAIEIALKEGKEVPGCELRDNYIPRSK